MPQSYDKISKRHNLAQMVRAKAQPYLKSNKKYDHDQGNILNNIADDIMSGDLDMACLRMDAIHHNIKTSLPFEVLDYLDRPEMGLQDD